MTSLRKCIDTMLTSYWTETRNEAPRWSSQRATAIASRSPAPSVRSRAVSSATPAWSCGSATAPASTTSRSDTSGTEWRSASHSRKPLSSRVV